jgi:hypothetical protein
MSSSEAFPHTPHDDVAKKLRERLPEADGDHVEPLLLVVQVVAVGDPLHVLAAHEAFGEQETGR